MLQGSCRDSELQVATSRRKTTMVGIAYFTAFSRLRSPGPHPNSRDCNTSSTSSTIYTPEMQRVARSSIMSTMENTVTPEATVAIYGTVPWSVQGLVSVLTSSNIPAFLLMRGGIRLSITTHRSTWNPGTRPISDHRWTAYCKRYLWMKTRRWRWNASDGESQN